MSKVEKFPERAAAGAGAREPVGDVQRAGRNDVVLRGKVTCLPETRGLPSGAVVVSLRISVPRAATVMTRGSKQSVDVVDCTAWAAKPRASLTRCAPGDWVEVTGSLRRRFFRTGGGAASRVEIEVLHVRKVG
jgi:single-strand DNA-binding protein